MVLSGFTVFPVVVLLVVVVFGQFLQELKNSKSKHGVQVVMVQEHVPVTVVSMTEGLRVDTMLLKQLMSKRVGHTLFVLVVSIVASVESVLHVTVVHPT